MKFRERFVRWLMEPEVQKEVKKALAGSDVMRLQKEVNTLRNEKLFLINLLRTNGIKIPKRFKNL